MGKWVPDPKKAGTDRVTRLIAAQNAEAQRKAAKEAAEQADRACRANPRSRADQKVRRGGRG